MKLGSFMLLMVLVSSASSKLVGGAGDFPPAAHVSTVSQVAPVLLQVMKTVSGLVHFLVEGCLQPSTS